MSGNMDSTNKNTSEWVYDRLALLQPAPGEDPDRAWAYYCSHRRMAKWRRGLRRAAALAMLVASLLGLTTPVARGVARQLWNRFYMISPEAVRSMTPRLDRPLFFDRTTSPIAPARFAFDRAEARELAGFEPRLPATLIEQVASGLAVLKVSGPIDAKIKIRAANLTTALQRRGINDVVVPRDWEGVEIGYHLDAGVTVAFLGGAFSQAPPPSIVTPPGFPIIDFTEIALRAAGLSAADAHNARNMFVDSGGALAIVPSDAKSNFRELPLKSGHGLLFENDTNEDERQKCSFCAGPHERVLTWAFADRIFQFRSQTMTVEQALELANAVN
jgi:hypothetical protein